MRHRRLRAPAAAAAVIGLLATVANCHQAILTAPPDSTIVVHANPPFIPAHGGVSEITAVVMEPMGTPVPDGTVVQFFTTLGRIDEQGRTNDGVARVNLVSDARSGEAQVRAISGPATSDEITVRIGSALPTRVIVVANPPRLTQSRTTQVVANVFDEDGNPVANVPVFFTTNGSTESFDSAGNPVFTDNNGQAEDVMRTRHPREEPAKTVTITATTSNGVSGTTTVTIN